MSRSAVGIHDVTPPASSAFLAAAVDTVRTAGTIQMARFETAVRVQQKGTLDIVTDVDLEIESVCRALIAERFPDHEVLAEEASGGHTPRSAARYRWLFDPLDGTVNYAHGIPFFCSSLALEVDGVAEVAAIYDPIRQELFSAVRGRGAWRNEERIVVSSVSRLADAVVGCGFPHGAVARDRGMEELLGTCAIRARGLRRLGSAALDLCCVACTRMDAFWDRHLKPWDLAAGALIVLEAGGCVSALDGGAFDPYEGAVLASNNRIHAELRDIVSSTVYADTSDIGSPGH